MSDNEHDSMRELRSPTLWQVARSVMSAAFGVQKREILERDFRYGKASQFITLGIIFTILFIIMVWGLVMLVIELAGA